MCTAIVPFGDRLGDAIERVGTPILAGIDPRPEQLPPGFLDRYEPNLFGVAQAIGRFACEVVEIVAGRVAAVKFQSAFFEAYGVEGLRGLHTAIGRARERDLLVILDGKRNDIGSTAVAYAEGYLGRVPAGPEPDRPWGVDALTINPYLGTDGVAPFVEVARREGAGLFVLVKTSNASGGEFQDLIADGRPVYRHVADRLVGWAGPLVGRRGYSSVGAVVGATYPEQLAELRAAMPGVPILVPGYGAQGGTARDVAAAFDDRGHGAIVNVSRHLTFAYERPEYRAEPDWRRAVDRALDDAIADLAANTPAGRLR